MTLTNEISSLTIPVDYYGADHKEQQKDVRYRIYQQDDWFKAIPVLSADERKEAGLQETLVFICIDHTVVAANHMEEESLAIIKQIIMQLEVQELI